MSEQLESLEPHVDGLLLTLRRAMLGGLPPCLPEYAPSHSGQRSAIRTATEHLTFCFAAANAPVSTDQLLRFRSRIYAVLTFLLFECNPEERNYNNLLKLASLDINILSQTTAKASHTPHSFRSKYQRASEIDGGLESALLFALEQAHALPTPQACSAAVGCALQALKTAD